MTITAITNVTMIDGTGNDAIEQAVVLVEKNHIKAVGTSQTIAIPSDATIIDGGGQYLLPGLIDTHVHMALEIKNVQESLLTPFSYRFFEAAKRLETTIQTGITSVRDAGFADAGIKKAVEDGLVNGPRMQVSINPLTITGGHGDSWNISGIDTTQPVYPGMPDGKCDGREEVRKTVREMLRAGADVVKVHATGGVSSPTDHPEFTQFSQEELEVMVEEATFRKGVKVMAHGQGAEGIKNAVRAGIHSIEHGIFIDDEALELMLEHGTYLVPTLLAPLAVLEAAETSNTMAPYAIEKSKEVIDIHKKSIEKAYKAGVKIAMGTDAGVFPHGINLRELGLMCEIGMSPMEAIVASTKTAAECMGWGEKVGTIEAGKWADLIIVNGNPLADIHILENHEHITFVMKDGNTYKDTLLAI
ncbi:metal-dependent hydrolase family protein [Shouchella lehensis]|uniref:Amidohydrolase family protein n=1 Tax=Shouchella lehensis TaxID=300825 RepID=A0A4Y7WLZ3_9BACI|nr:amidohydrolase family protein [Shouchella lehensis]MBG9783063.1 aryldialkylphosphatase [Shouchella lehensis]TES49578.1 amidohydrolase family protein [Shouchella lehensis]